MLILVFQLKGWDNVREGRRMSFDVEESVFKKEWILAAGMLFGIWNPACQLANGFVMKISQISQESNQPVNQCVLYRSFLTICYIFVCLKVCCVLFWQETSAAKGLKDVSLHSSTPCDLKKTWILSKNLSPQHNIVYCFVVVFNSHILSVFFVVVVVDQQKTKKKKVNRIFFFSAQVLVILFFLLLFIDTFSVFSSPTSRRLRGQYLKRRRRM